MCNVLRVPCYNAMRICTICDIHIRMYDCTGLFVDELVTVARKELAWETDYIREAKCQNMFRSG